MKKIEEVKAMYLSRLGDETQLALDALKSTGGKTPDAAYYLLNGGMTMIMSTMLYVKDEGRDDYIESVCELLRQGCKKAAAVIKIMEAAEGDPDVSEIVDMIVGKDAEAE